MSAARRPLAKAEAEARLRGDDWKKLKDALQRLPPEVDAGLAAEVVLEQLGDGHLAAWTFGRHCQLLPARVIREVLRKLPAQQPTPERLFLREAVDASASDAGLTKAWKVALQSLLDLSLTYAWGSAQRRARFKALAKNATILRAIQSAVVGSAHPPLDMLAVLAADGSDASVDALMPAFSSSDAEARLGKLQVHAAKTPAIAAMLAAITARRLKKEQGSTAVAFVSEVLALAEPLKSVKFTLVFGSVESETGGVPLYQAHLAVDSKWDQWWAFDLTRVDRAMSMKRTSFGARDDVHDDLELGGSSIAELPKWVANAAKKLKISWSRDALVSGSLRGKKREQLVEWLFSVSS